MNRRGFFKSLALIASAASLSPTIFIPKFEPVRWKPTVVPVDFTQFLLSQVPVYDRLIMQSIRPTDSWLKAVCEPPDKTMWEATSDELIIRS